MASRMAGEVEGDALVWCGCSAVDGATGAALASRPNSANELAATLVAAAAERKPRRLNEWLCGGNMMTPWGLDADVRTGAPPPEPRRSARRARYGRGWAS